MSDQPIDLGKARERRRQAMQTTDGRPPLLDAAQMDRALRDLMPVVEWLTNADAAMADGATRLGEVHLHAAMAALRNVPDDSPALKAYLRWLEQNTALGEEPPRK